MSHYCAPQEHISNEQVRENLLETNLERVQKQTGAHQFQVGTEDEGFILLFVDP